MAYKLSAELEGHTSDVRGLAAFGSDMLVSVSRDNTGRIWKRTGPHTFIEDSVLVGHDKYVSSVVVIPPYDKYPQGLIATGSMDTTVCVWDAANPGTPVQRLRGHTGNVCALAVSRDGRTLVSGSWDKTAKVWVDGECVHTLRDHEHAVWGVLVLDDGSVVTASADKLIRIWRDGRLVHTLTGHTDCVRALAATAGGFASASNDGSVREWTVDGSVRELHGHTSLVYAVAAADDILISGGEDRAMRVWHDGRLQNTVLVPSMSVWAVAVLSNGDIACGTNDGRIRVFTQDAARVADTDAQKQFEEKNAVFALSAKTMGDVSLGNLPGPERLKQSGDSDQVVMIKDGSQVTAHQWNVERKEWIQVGHIVDAAGQTQKQVFDGREYDYVFDVDIQEGAPALKLPYNATENPYSAAQRFLERNELSLEYLDTVADFITKNSDGVQLGPQQPHVDPFTGGSRYVPGQSQAGADVASDPFTGNRYIPAQTTSVYSPPSEYIINRAGNCSAIVKKLAEFNAELAQSSDTHLAVSAQDMQHVGELETTVSEPACSVLLQLVQAWPVDRRFPGLDLLRLAVAASPLPLTCHAADGKTLVALVIEASNIESAFVADSPLSKSDEINAMMGVRALANMFAHSQGIDEAWAARSRILNVLDGSWSRATNKNLVTSLSNLYFNLAIAAAQKGDDDEGLNILSACSRFLEHTDNADAQLRLVNVFGVLAAKFQLCKDSARVLGDETIVILGIMGKSEAAKAAAKAVGAFLSV
ncbi:WD repeat protein Lub1 [Coemansia sp. RSA 1822]|nr:WD repeat protein Lub1 [Coemansia sp. RSA 638]KAJ2561780.1 WD repeat protein Lub1 [Coemansia sp. RSA 1822]